MRTSRVSTILSTSAASLGLQFLFQVLVGWYLNRAYIPDPKHAHDTMERILSATPHAQLASFHYWAGAFFILHSFVHMCLMMFTGWYRPPNHWRWFTSLAIFACAMLFQLTGNLFPYDQHGVQTAAVEAGIAASMPMGKPIATLLFGGEPAMNANTLATWYMAHRFLIPLALILGAFGAIGTYLKRHDIRPVFWLSALVALIPLAIGLFVRAPLGTAATPDDYNKFSAMVSWYTWPLHGSLDAFAKIDPGAGWIGTALVPGLFALFLIAAPFLSKRIANSGIQFIFVVFLAFFFGTGALFGGSFAPLTGTRDPIVAAQDTGPKPTTVTPIDEAMAERGRKAFNELGCGGCHGTDGLKASGGPALDKSYKDHPEPEWFVEFIKDPKSKKPGSTMPGYPSLTADQLRSMAEFLRKPR